MNYAITLSSELDAELVLEYVQAIDTGTGLNLLSFGTPEFIEEADRAKCKLQTLSAVIEKEKGVKTRTTVEYAMTELTNQIAEDSNLFDLVVS